MPAIESLLSSKYKGFLPDEPIEHQSPVTSVPLKRSPFLRCPTPPLAPISVDNLDQFELAGHVPQYRVLIG